MMEGWDFKSWIKSRLKWGLKPVSDGLFHVCPFRKKKTVAYYNI